MDQGNNKSSKSSLEQRIWRREDKPIRQLLLWGKDASGNKGFLILYGVHNGKNEEAGYVLEENITYTNYIVVIGESGHMPSIPEVKAMESYQGELYLYKSIGSSEPYYYHKKVDNFQSLGEQTIILPYFSSLSYTECVERIWMQRKEFSGFQIAKNPNELLELPQIYENYFACVCEMMSHFNLYIRKKRLAQLIEYNLPIDFWQHLLSVGSTEVIAGIFLAFANKNERLLLEEASKIQETAPFAQQNYWDGMIRCAKLYSSCLNAEKKKERIEQIKEEVPQIDLPIVYMYGREISPDEKLDGNFYRRCAMDGNLQKYSTHWVKENNKWKSQQVLNKPYYTKGIYNDGWKLDIIKVKYTIQEVEILRMADIIGEIAYYLDTPRLKYYFIATNQMKVLRYLKRYVRRIMDQYAIDNPDLFMQAMQALLTRYKPEDYLSKFENNYQFNEYIKYYLYNSWNEKAPTASYEDDWEVYWQRNKERREFLQNDQLLNLEGRFEFHPEIWNTHIKETLEIALVTQIIDIQKACYFILKDAWQEGRLEAFVSEEQMVSFTNAKYLPLAQMFQTIFAQNLSKKTYLTSERLLICLKSGNATLFQVAVDYIKKYSDQIEPEIYVSMLFFENRETIFELWKEQVLCLSKKAFITFVKELIQKEQQLQAIALEEEKEVLSYLAPKIIDLNQIEKEELYIYTSNKLLTCKEENKWIFDFIEELLCSLEVTNIHSMAQSSMLDATKVLTARGRRVYAMLCMIEKNEIASASQIEDILESGTASMINLFYRYIQDKQSVIQNKPSIFLIIAESNLQVLHSFIQEVVEQAEIEKQKELIQLLIDSPLQKVYLLGLDLSERIFGDAIPKEWLLQMLEHPTKEIKSFISKKIDFVINNMGSGDTALFLYYVRTLLYMPNKVSKEKSKICKILPDFVKRYPNYLQETQHLLYDIGGSNHKKDAESALVALAQIKSEV